MKSGPSARCGGETMEAMAREVAMRSASDDPALSDARQGDGPVWCDRCSALLAEHESDVVDRCPTCAAVVDWGAAVRRSRAWLALRAADARYRPARQAVDAAADRLREAQQAAAAAWGARQAAQRTWDALNPHVARAGPVAPAHIAPRERVRIPLAVLLQGTGAVLLLAALTTASAVLWGSLPQALQVLALLAAVALVGATTVVSRPLPATTVILAVLTAASGVVVALSLPTIAPVLDGRWYPTAASAAGATCLLVAGRLSAVSFWWRTGWIGLGLSGVLAGAALLTDSALEPGSTAWLSLAALLLATVAVPLILVTVAMRDREPEAADTSWWTAMAVGLSALAATLAAISRWLADPAADPATETAWIAAGLLALAVLGYLAFAAAYLRHRSGAAAFLAGAAAAAAVLPTLTLGALEVDSAGAAALAVAPTAAALALLVLAARRWRRTPWLLRTLAAAGAALTGSAALINVVGLSQSQPPPFAWLLATLTALTVAFAMWTYAVLQDDGGWALAGLLLGSAAWLTTWAAGHLGEAVEVVTLGVLAALLGSWWLGVRLDRWGLRGAPARLPQMAILLFLLPTVQVSLRAIGDGQPDGPRLVLQAVGLAAVAALASRQGTGATLPAAGAAAAGVAHAWASVAAEVADPALEWYSLPAALGVALVAAAGVVDRWTTPRAALATALAAASAPSAMALLAMPGWTTSTAARLALVVAAGSLATALAWRWPISAWAIATLGLAASLRVYLVWADPSVQSVGQGWAPLEVLTLPAAIAVGASAALACRIWAPSRAALLGATTIVVAAAAPTTALIASDLSVRHGDTALRVLATLAAAGLVAVLLDEASPLGSAVAATVVVLLPLALYGQWLAERPSVLLEAITVPLALAVALVLGWIRRPDTPGRWWRLAVRPAALACLAASTVWAVWAPATGIGPIAWPRMVVVAGAWAGAGIMVRARPRAAGLAGAVAVLVVWADAVLAVSRTADPVPEALTWPTAAALAAWCALGAWAAGLRHSSWLVATPAAAVAMLPTAALAWQDGTAGWRVWFSLIAGGLLVAVGARREWAGFVFPGLAVLGMVALPVLVHWAQDLPGWVPLSLVGLLLLVLGARMEAARRRGGQLRHWVAHLH